jgi:hypothetical protein
MMAFPERLFDSLARCESTFQRANDAANIRRQRKLDAMKQQMKELAEAEDQIRRSIRKRGLTWTGTNNKKRRKCSQTNKDTTQRSSSSRGRSLD